MKRNNLCHMLGVLVLAGCLLGASGQAIAGNRWLDPTFSTDLSLILSDDFRKRIYLADSGTGELVVINTKFERIMKRIPVGGPISDMAFSKNKQFLAVASGDMVTFVKLKNLKSLTKAFPTSIRSLAFDANGKTFFVDNDANRSMIYHYDQKTDTVLNTFGVGPNLTTEPYQGLLKTDETGEILYVGERGISPLSIHKIDVSGTDPVFLAEDGHGDLGSNLRDFVISPKYDELYVASGAPYGIQVVDSNTMEFITLLSTDPYPAGVDVDRYGDSIYGLPRSPYNNFLYKYDAQTRELINSYELLSQVLNGEGQIRGIAVERFDKKSFVIHGKDFNGELKVQVVDTSDK